MKNLKLPYYNTIQIACFTKNKAKQYFRDLQNDGDSYVENLEGTAGQKQLSRLPVAYYSTQNYKE
ncbi:hypothetical protein GCM10023206_25430 [Acinetobacter puyangensis]|uniref:Uncharacterized protein n=1 Tax=Acinetobacter puyangensis TaxID=1096779 RepID=A0A240E4J6_9GAMM|nr:hypothetical protein [Acinetobacter puyangensis]SNX43688.1 hypothetical protein SAMN05421731_101730 [Acinetobacter puyangensis]